MKFLFYRIKKLSLYTLWTSLLAIFVIISLPNFLSNVSSDTVVTSNVGTIKVDNGTIVVKPYESRIVKIYGNVIDIGQRDKVILSYILPDGSRDGVTTVSTKKGYFETLLVLNDKSPKGVYEIVGLHKTKLIGSISFSVIGNGTNIVDVKNNNETEQLKSESIDVSDLILNEFCLDNTQTLDIVIDGTINKTSIKLNCIKQGRSFSITIIDNGLEKMMEPFNVSKDMFQVFSINREHQIDDKKEKEFQTIGLQNKSSESMKLQEIGPKISFDADYEDNIYGMGLRPVEI